MARFRSRRRRRNKRGRRRGRRVGLKTHNKGKHSVYIGNPMRFYAKSCDIKLKSNTHTYLPYGINPTSSLNNVDFCGVPHGLANADNAPVPMCFVLRGLSTLNPELHMYGPNTPAAGYALTSATVRDATLVNGRAPIDYNHKNFWIREGMYEEYIVKSLIVTFHLDWQYEPQDGTDTLDYDVTTTGLTGADAIVQQLRGETVMAAIVTRAYDTGCPFTEDKGYSNFAPTANGVASHSTAPTAQWGATGSQIRHILCPSSYLNYHEQVTSLFEGEQRFTKVPGTLGGGVSFKLQIPVHRLLKRFQNRSVNPVAPWNVHDQNYASTHPNVSTLILVYPIDCRFHRHRTLRPRLTMQLDAIVVGHHHQVDEVQILNAGEGTVPVDPTTGDEVVPEMDVEP